MSWPYNSHIFNLQTIWVCGGKCVLYIGNYSNMYLCLVTYLNHLAYVGYMWAGVADREIVLHLPGEGATKVHCP